MANNEIKFVFVGDTADFDKAIDSIIKKANKAKDIDKEANKVRKQAVNLEKILKDEYEKASKNAGSLKSITEKLAKEDAKRLEIAKKLSNESLTQNQRQSLSLDLAKSNARSAGLKKAGVKGVGKIAGVAVLGAIAAGAGAAISGTIEAINNAQTTRSGALQAGQSVEQFQINQFAKGLNRSPKDIADSLNALGVIIDADLNKELSDAGHQLNLVGDIIYNELVPAFAFAAKKVAGFGLDLAALIKTIMQVGFKETVKEAAIVGGKPIAMRVFESAMGVKPRESNFTKIYEENRKKMDLELGKIFTSPEISGVKNTPIQNFQDSLSRIGLFKSGAESQRQIQKASLVQLKSIARQTKGLKKSVEEA